MLGKAFESEFHYLIVRMGIAGWIGHLLAIAFFGIVVPYRQGFDFLDVMILLAYAGLPCLFAAPLVAESVASRRPSPPREGYLAQILTPFLFAILWNAVILASGFATINLRHRFPRLLLPNTKILICIGILSLALVFFAACMTGWMSLNVKTAAAAKNHSRRFFLLLLLAVVMWTRMGPPGWKSRLEARLTPEEIGPLVLPIALGLVALAILLLRAGATRRIEEAAGPVFKLDP